MMISRSLGPQRPMTPPAATRTEATAYEQAIMVVMSTLIALPHPPFQTLSQNA